MTDQPTKPDIVQFDVGGRIFKTSRSLIDQHEDTMLARLVSDTWQEDPNKSVFIDRDGDIFAQVLNYLRYGSITLPDNIVKDMFLRDLDFYGIVPEEDSVKSASEGWASKIDDRRDKIKDYGDKMRQLQLEYDIEFLANHCASKYISPYPDYSRGYIHIFRPKDDDKADNADKEKQTLWNAVDRVYQNKSMKEVFSKALMKFGLSLKGKGLTHSGTTRIVMVTPT